MESFFRAVEKANKYPSASVGKVVKITGNTCSVERENLPPLHDVRLNAIEADFSDKIIIYPKIGSQVLCLVIAGAKEETAVVQYSEIDKVLIEIGGAKFEMSAGKFQIKNKKADQKKITDGLLDALKSAVIKTPNGPGKFALPTVMKFDKLKSDNNNLYE